MSFLDEVSVLERGPGGICSVGTLLQALGESERTELLAALESSYQSTAISRAAKERGWDIGRSAVARHRRGECRCRTS